MTRHSITSSLLLAKMCLPVNQLAFDLLPPLPALLATSNPRSRRTASKRLNHFIPTDDTTPLTATPSTAIRIVIRAKSVLYAANPDVGLQTTQRMRRTREYVNTSLILRAITVRRMTIIRRLLTSILIQNPVLAITITLRQRHFGLNLQEKEQHRHFLIPQLLPVSE